MHQQRQRGYHSLNECFFCRPVILADLGGLLLWFRTYRVALIADIEKAFLQTGLQPMERDVTKDLWIKNPTQPLTKDNMQIYYIGKLVRGQKEHSDWFFEGSEFC